MLLDHPNTRIEGDQNGILFLIGSMVTAALVDVGIPRRTAEEYSNVWIVRLQVKLAQADYVVRPIDPSELEDTAP